MDLKEMGWEGVDWIHLAQDRGQMDGFVNTIMNFLCFVDRASRYNRVKQNQLDTHLILSIFRQPLHVSGLSRPIIRRYNRMYTTIGTIPIQSGQQTVI